MTEEELMMTSILNCRRIDLYVDKPVLSDQQIKKLDEMKGRRDDGEPLQYIIGHCDFMGVKIYVNENVFIPRPETEILVEAALRKLSVMDKKRCLRILDLGTGSGNIAIALAKNILDGHITSMDISKEALLVARRNAELNLVDHKITFIQEDMIDFLQNERISEKFDMIISNPPYIPLSLMAQIPHDVQCEPKIALNGHGDGLYFCRNIIENSFRFLDNDSWLFMEIGDYQASDITAMIQQYESYSSTQFLKDYRKIDRIVASYVCHHEAKIFNDYLV